MAISGKYGILNEGSDPVLPGLRIVLSQIPYEVSDGTTTFFDEHRGRYRHDEGKRARQSE